LIQANGSLKAVEYLLNCGAVAFAKDSEGVTPIHVAAWNGRVDLIEPLIAKGAKGFASIRGLFILLCFLMDLHQLFVCFDSCSLLL
jgi:ankyrin repeat protein